MLCRANELGTSKKGPAGKRMLRVSLTKTARWPSIPGTKPTSRWQSRSLDPVPAPRERSGQHDRMTRTVRSRIRIHHNPPYTRGCLRHCRTCYLVLPLWLSLPATVELGCAVLRSGRQSMQHEYSCTVLFCDLGQHTSALANPCRRSYGNASALSRINATAHDFKT